MSPWHSLLPKISDDGDSESNDREHRANVGHPSEGNGIWVTCGVGVNVLQRLDMIQVEG